MLKKLTCENAAGKQQPTATSHKDLHKLFEGMAQKHGHK